MKECPFKNSFCILFSQATARHNQTNLQHTTESIHILFFFSYTKTVELGPQWINPEPAWFCQLVQQPFSTP